MDKSIAHLDFNATAMACDECEELATHRSPMSCGCVAMVCTRHAAENDKLRKNRNALIGCSNHVGQHVRVFPSAPLKP